MRKFVIWWCAPICAFCEVTALFRLVSHRDPWTDSTGLLFLAVLAAALFIVLSKSSSGKEKLA